MFLVVAEEHEIVHMAEVSAAAHGFGLKRTRVEAMLPAVWTLTCEILGGGFAT